MIEASSASYNDVVCLYKKNEYWYVKMPFFILMLMINTATTILFQKQLRWRCCCCCFYCNNKTVSYLNSTLGLTIYFVLVILRNLQIFLIDAYRHFGLEQNYVQVLVTSIDCRMYECSTESLIQLTKTPNLLTKTPILLTKTPNLLTKTPNLLTKTPIWVRYPAGLAPN